MSRVTGLTLTNIFKAIAPDSNESNVEQKLIIPLLHLLGYSHADWQPQAIVSKFKLDFLVQPQELDSPYPPYLVIEVKAANKNISHNGWQIHKYMRQSGAILGLLTNGYQFHIFYNSKSQIIPILDYAQGSLIENFELFHNILCKATCLKFNQALERSQQNVRSKFLDLINKQDMLGLFKKKQPDPEQSFSIIETEDKNKAMIITVFNNKGGVGKTTTTINLAAALSKLGKRVLLIDIDAQANLTMGLGIDPLTDIEHQGKKDIVNLLIDPKTSLKDTTYSKRWNDISFDIVPSHIRLSEMESEINQLVNRDLTLARKLNSSKYNCADDYDFVFIDPPPSFSVVNNISLMASSAILIPTQLAPYPIRALEYVIRRAKSVEESKGEPLPILGIAISMYNRVARKFNETMKEQMEEILAKCDPANTVNIFPEETWIPQLNIVATASSFRKEYPLSYAEFDDELNGRDKESAQDAFESYLELAKHLIKINEQG